MSASPPPARVACAMAWALSGFSLERALTRITSSGVSWKTRLKPSGSTKRTVSRAACTATRDAERDLQGAERTSGSRAQDRVAAASPAASASASSSTSTAIAIGPADAARPRPSSSSAVASRLGARHRRGARCTRAVHVEREQVDRRRARTRTRAPRGRSSAPSTGSTSGRSSARTRPSFITRGRRVRAMPLLLAGTAASSSAPCRPGSRCRRL